jgi:hypothetical protein
MKKKACPRLACLITSFRRSRHLAEHIIEECPFYYKPTYWFQPTR